MSGKGKSIGTRIGLVAVSLSMLLTACGNADSGAGSRPGDKSKAAPKEVIFGVVQALTGPNAAWGQASWNGVQLAAEIINEQGGIKALGGAKIKPVIYDTESKPEVAQAQTEKAISAGAIILTGSVQSAASALASTVAERLQVAFIAQDDDQKLVERGYKYTFKIRPHAQEYSRSILNFGKEIGQKNGTPIKKIALLFENNGIGQNAMKLAQELLKSMPEYEVVDAALYDASTTDFTGYIAKYKAAGVQMLFGHQSVNTGIQITRTMKQLKFKPLVYSGISGAQISAAYVDALGGDATDVISTQAWAPSLNIKGLDEIKKRYQAKFNAQMDDTVAAGISVTAIAWDALERAASYDPKTIRDAVAATDIKTPERNYLFIDGAKFDQNGQNIAGVPVMTQIRDKQWIPIAPSQYADGKPIFPMWSGK